MLRTLLGYLQYGLIFLDPQVHLFPYLRMFNPADEIVRVPTPQQIYIDKNKDRVRNDLLAQHGFVWHATVLEKCKQDYESLEAENPHEWISLHYAYIYRIVLIVLGSLMKFVIMTTVSFVIVMYNLENAMKPCKNGPIYYFDTQNLFLYVFWNTFYIGYYCMNMCYVVGSLATTFKFLQQVTDELCLFFY